MDTSQIFEEKLYKLRKRKLIRRSLTQVVLTCAIIYLLLGVFFGISVVKGESMSPTLPPGSVVIYNRLASKFKRGDIVVLSKPDTGEQLIKRIYATEGQTVEIYKQPDMRRITAGGLTVETEFEPFELEPGYVYVLGDNTLESSDSRDFGPVPTGDIIGKVIRSFG